MARPTKSAPGLGTRLVELRGDSSREEFAAALGVHANTIGNYERGDRQPDTEFLGLLRERIGVDINWLITGNSDAANAQRPSSGKLVASYDPDSDTNDEGYSHETWKPRFPGARPEIDVRLGAGEGTVGQMLSIGANGGMSGHRVVAEWVLPEAFLVGVIEANAARSIVMEIIGDSMQPTYQPGDRVIVDLAQTKLVADTVYAISDGFSEPQIKRLQRVPFSQPARVRIISDNPALPTDEVELDRVHIIGRICGVMARR